MKRTYVWQAFTDLKFNVCGALLMLLTLAIFLITDEAAKKSEGNIELPGEYVVVVEWDGASADDIDVWVLDPAGNVACFMTKQAGLMYLDVDDLGHETDSIVIDGKTIVVNLNRETVTLRGVVPGEYTVNLHAFSKIDSSPTVVTVRLIRLAPYEVIDEVQVTLTYDNQEATAGRYTMGADGKVGGITRVDRSVVTRYLSAAP